MATRKEIREGVMDELSPVLLPDDIEVKEDELVPGRKVYFITDRRKRELTQRILNRQDSQGVAIRVNRELPTTNVEGIPDKVNWYDGFRHGQMLMKLAGYVAVKPLIRKE